MLDFTVFRSLLPSSWGVFHPLVPLQYKFWCPSYARLNASNRIFSSKLLTIKVVLEFRFGHSKCHFFGLKDGHFWQKWLFSDHKKWHFWWQNQNSKTAFIVQTFPRYGPYNFYFMNLSLLGAIWPNFDFGDLRAHFGQFSLVKIDFLEIHFHPSKSINQSINFFWQT